MVGNKSAGSFDFGLIPFATYHVDKSGADDPHFDPLVLIWMVKFLFGSKVTFLDGMKFMFSESSSFSSAIYFQTRLFFFKSIFSQNLFSNCG